jgi:hypothetical protein
MPPLPTFPLERCLVWKRWITPEAYRKDQDVAFQLRDNRWVCVRRIRIARNPRIGVSVGLHGSVDGVPERSVAVGETATAAVDAPIQGGALRTGAVTAVVVVLAGGDPQRVIAHALGHYAMLPVVDDLLLQ